MRSQRKKTLAEKREVEEALCTARDSIPEPVDFEERLETFRTAVDMMNDPDADIEKLNVVLKKCINKITYSRPQAINGRRNDAPFVIDVNLKIPKAK